MGNAKVRKLTQKQIMSDGIKGLRKVEQDEECDSFEVACLASSAGLTRVVCVLQPR